MTEILEILQLAVDAGASDIFIVAGAPVNIKHDGHIVELDSEKLMPAETLKLVADIYKLAGRSIEKLEKSRDDDFSFGISTLARFRINTFSQRGSLAAVIRVVSFTIPDWQEINIPSCVMNLADLRSGLVLVTGTAGSGKSTTLACIVDRINRTRRCHIITMEDPIEFLHKDNLSIVSQREISIDTENFHTALRACMRQTPDVIQIGELRDFETIQLAITAAETGHLVFASLHTKDAPNTIDRIIDVFPSNQQEQVRVQLSMVLHSVISQQLLPDRSGSQIPAFEIMHINNAIRSLIRDKKMPQIKNVIQTGKNEGMQTMDQYIYELYRSNKIARQTALDYAQDPSSLLQKI